MEPLLCRLRDERAHPALRGVSLVGRALAVKEAVAGYEKVAGAKVNFDKSEGLRLGAWKGGIPLPGPFRWSDGLIRILGVWFGSGLQLEWNWLGVRAKIETQVGTWLRKRLSLKGRVEVCAVYIFPLIRYRLSVLRLPKNHRVALIQSLFKLLWKGQSPLVRRQVCYQRPQNGGLGMLNLESHWLAERLAYLGRSLTKDTVWRHKVRDVFPRLKSNPEAERASASGLDFKSRDETPFVRECCKALHKLPRSSDLSRSRKELYRELVAGSVSDPLEKRLGWSLEENHSQWNWVPGTSVLNNSEFPLTWRLARNALALNDWAYRACITDTPDCPRCGSGLEETASHAFYYCERVRPFWSHVGELTARISPKQLVLLDVGYIVDNVDPLYQGEKRMVFLVILAVARMVIWETRKKGLYESAIFCHRDLILFFRYQLRVKIRCDRKRLDHITLKKNGCMQRDWSYKRGQCWSHLSLFFLCMATMVRFLRNPTPSK